MRLRGASGVVSAALLAAVLAASLGALVAFERRAVSAVLSAGRAASLSADPQMVLELEGGCSGGWAPARLEIRGPSPGPARVRVYEAGSGRLLYESSLSGGAAELRLSCSSGQVIVVEGGGATWVYDYRLDPTKPCLEGRVVRVGELEQGASCIQGDPGAVREAASMAAARVLDVIYGGALAASWARAPLQPSESAARSLGWGGFQDFSALLSASQVVVEAVAGLPQGGQQLSRTVRLDAKVGWSWPCPDPEATAALEGSVLAQEGAWLRLRHYRVVSRSWVTGACGDPGSDSTYDYMHHVLDGEAPLLSTLWGGYTKFITRKWRYPLDVENPFWYVHQEVSGGVGGYLAVPLLLVRGGSTVEISVGVVDRDSWEAYEYNFTRYTWHITLGRRDSSLSGEGALDTIPTYVSVKLHVFDANSWDPAKLIVTGSASVPGELQGKVQRPLLTIELARAALSSGNQHLHVDYRLDPDALLDKLGRSYKVAVAVVAVYYAEAGTARVLLRATDPWHPDYPVGSENFYEVPVADLGIYIYMAPLEVGRVGSAGTLLLPSSMSAEGSSGYMRVDALSGGSAKWKPAYSDRYHEACTWRSRSGTCLEKGVWHARVMVGGEKLYSTAGLVAAEHGNSTVRLLPNPAQAEGGGAVLSLSDVARPLTLVEVAAAGDTEKLIVVG